MPTMMATAATPPMTPPTIAPTLGPLAAAGDVGPVGSVPQVLVPPPPQAAAIAELCGAAAYVPATPAALCTADKELVKLVDDSAYKALYRFCAPPDGATAATVY